MAAENTHETTVLQENGKHEEVKIELSETRANGNKDPDETSELLTPVVESSKVKCENEIELQEIKITPNTATEKSLRLAIPTRGCSKVQFENDTELKEIKSTQYSGLKKAGGTPQPATPVTAALHSATQTMTRKIPIWCCTILFSISVTILFFFIYFQIRDIDE